MSANKKDELLRNLTRRDSQKPPMEITYANKGIVLDQMTERPGLAESFLDANTSNSKNDSKINNASDIASNTDININSDIDSKNDINNVSDNNIPTNSNADLVGHETKSFEAQTLSTEEPDAVSSTPEDSLDFLLFGKKQSSNKVYKGFYLEPEIARILDKLARKQGKGIQSQLVNESLRKVFKEKGLL